MRRGAHTPIFDRKIRYGSVTVGAQIGEVPTTPPPTLGVLVDSIALNCDRLFIVDDVAFVVSFANDSIYSIDVSDPTNISIIDTLTDTTNLNGAFDVVVDGNYAYVVAADADRVTVVDISDPTNMSVAGSLTNGAINFPTNIAKVGNYVFVVSTDGTSAFHSLNVTTTTPSITDVVTSGLGGAVTSIEIVGDYAYMGSLASSDLKRINISDPTNLGARVSLAGGANNCEGMVLLGNYLFTTSAAVTTNGIYATNVTNPASPSNVSSLIDNTNFLSARAIDSLGAERVVMGCAGANTLQLINVSNPAAMALEDTITDAKLNGIRDLQVYNGHVFTCSRASGASFAAWSIT